MSIRVKPKISWTESDVAISLTHPVPLCFRTHYLICSHSAPKHSQQAGDDVAADIAAASHLQIAGSIDVSYSFCYFLEACQSVESVPAQEGCCCWSCMRRRRTRTRTGRGTFPSFFSRASNPYYSLYSPYRLRRRPSRSVFSCLRARPSLLGKKQTT